MKPLLLFIYLMVLCAVTQAQVASDYLASTGGIGPFKIGMSPAAAEKLLNVKLKLPKSASTTNYDEDTVMCSYKAMKLELVFARQYFGNDTVPQQGIYRINSSYPMVKTKSGVGIGDNKLKIVKLYEQYRLDIWPDWGQDGKPNPKRSTVTLYDNESIKVLIFHLDNNIITAITATQHEGD